MSGGFLESRRVLALRASDRDPRESAKRCKALGAEEEGTSAFCDTCFRTGHGDIKLREHDDGTAVLIYSTLPNLHTDEEAFHHVGVHKAEPLLDALLGIGELRGVVAIERRLYTWEEMRVHLDTVEGLGDRLGAEVSITGETGPSLARTRLHTLRRVLGIHKSDLTHMDYAELLNCRLQPSPRAS